jgi:hypothetical protein
VWNVPALFGLAANVVVASITGTHPASSTSIGQHTSWLDLLAGVTVPVVAGLVVGIIVFYVQKNREKWTTTRAILSEIHTLLEIVIGHLKWFRGRMAAGDTQHFLIPFGTSVYDAQIANIGSVDATPVPAIVAFYSYLKFLNALQSARKRYDRAGKDYVFVKVYHEALTTFLRRFGSRFEAAFSNAGLPSLEAKYIDRLNALLEGTKEFLDRFPPDASFGPVSEPESAAMETS